MIALLAVAGLALLVAGLVAVAPLVKRLADHAAADEKKRLMADVEARAEEERARAARDPKEHPAFLYCDGKRDYCHSTEQQTVKVYASKRDFSARSGVACRRKEGLCIDPAQPMALVPAGTRIMVLAEVPIESGQSIRIEQGPNKGKVGIVDTKYIHDEAPR